MTSRRIVQDKIHLNNVEVERIFDQRMMHFNVITELIILSQDITIILTINQMCGMINNCFNRLNR